MYGCRQQTFACQILFAAVRLTDELRTFRCLFRRIGRLSVTSAAARSIKKRRRNGLRLVANTYHHRSQSGPFRENTQYHCITTAAVYFQPAINNGRCSQQADIEMYPFIYIYEQLQLGCKTSCIYIHCLHCCVWQLFRTLICKGNIRAAISAYKPRQEAITSNLKSFTIVCCRRIFRVTWHSLCLTAVVGVYLTSSYPGRCRCVGDTFSQDTQARSQATSTPAHGGIPLQILRNSFQCTTRATRRSNATRCKCSQNYRVKCARAHSQ